MLCLPKNYTFWNLDNSLVRPKTNEIQCFLISKNKIKKILIFMLQNINYIKQSWNVTYETSLCLINITKQMCICCQFIYRICWKNSVFFKSIFQVVFEFFLFTLKYRVLFLLIINKLWIQYYIVVLQSVFLKTKFKISKKKKQ